MLLGMQYLYKRIPFAIKPRPKILQRYISKILHEIPRCFVYIDDAVIYKKTKEEHACILKLILNKLLERDFLRINFDKSKFFQIELEVLCYKINPDGIYPNTRCLNNEVFNYRKIQGICNQFGNEKKLLI